MPRKWGGKTKENIMNSSVCTAEAMEASIQLLCRWRQTNTIHLPQSNTTKTQNDDKKSTASDRIVEFCTFFSLWFRPFLDIMEELTSYSQSQAQKFLVLSATGCVSCVRVLARSVIETYRGYHEIVSFGGFINPPTMGGLENSHVKIRFNGPMVTLRGGKVSSPLIAATPVQVTIGMVPSTLNLDLPAPVQQESIPAEDSGPSEEDSDSATSKRQRKDESLASSSTKDE